MKIYPLIFSNNSIYRVARHSVFWIIWIAYYTVFTIRSFNGNLPLSDRFFSSLIEVSLSTIMDMAFCYSIIYFLLPQFLFRGRYIAMTLLWLLFSVIFIVAFELYISLASPVIRGWFHLKAPVQHSDYSWAFFSLFSQINMEGCMAAAIKLGKLTFIKQKEINLLKNEKADLQTQTNKIEMQPVFLVDIIERVERMADKSPLVVSDIIKKIRHLMMHVIYENSRAKVDLKKEVELINEYIELEQNTRAEVIKVNLSIAGNLESEYIASLVLLQCIQNAFEQVSALNGGDKKIDINIQVANGVLDLVIAWTKPLHTSTLAEGKNLILQNLNKRLNLIYPQSYEMKLLIQVDKVIQSLKINLKSAIN